MRAAARRLAEQINAGHYAALTPDQRYELRALSMELSAWADDVETMEVPTGRVVSLRPALIEINGGKMEVWR
jgi:hypothetical protein